MKRLRTRISKLARNKTVVIGLLIAFVSAGVLAAALVTSASGDCGSQGVQYKNNSKFDTPEHRRKQFGKSGRNLVSTKFMGQKVVVNKRVVKCLNKVEKELRASNAHYDVRTVGSYRPLNNTNSLPWQYHGYGAALDINAAQNPQCPGYDPNNRCNNRPPFTMPDYWVKTFEKYGFWWGGKYEHSAPDYMHFEFHRF